jgi:2-methylisocitrate lyase-like PEP mutase family enzyme
MTSPTDAFRLLHQGPDLLLLANAWDAGSARLVESLGARAVATTSAGVAWAHGYPDGDTLPVELLVASVRSIVRAIRVPLTIDVEGGYSDDPDAVAETIGAVVAAGAVGINLEDGGGSPELLAAKIRAIKARCDVFINARTDVYLRGLVAPDQAVAETLSRARVYREAGADGLFVPKLTDPAEIRSIADGGLPLNLLAWPHLAPAAELAALGVRRLSAGSAIAGSAWRRTATLAAGFLRDGRSDPLSADAMPYGEINALFARR